MRQESGGAWLGSSVPVSRETVFKPAAGLQGCRQALLLSAHMQLLSVGAVVHVPYGLSLGQLTA